MALTCRSCRQALLSPSSKEQCPAMEIRDTTIWEGSVVQVRAMAQICMVSFHGDETLPRRTKRMDVNRP
nr:hypothetical protein CFP56_30062 [Quercus suber]